MSEHTGRGMRQSILGTGAPIALFVVAAAAAAVLFGTLLPHGDAAVPASEPPVTDSASAPSAVTPIVIPPRPQPESKPEPIPAPEPLPEPTPEPSAPAQAPVELIVPAEPAAASAPRLVVPPLTGETVAAFSVDYPVFNETFGDWRTHDGVDIAAPLGTQVLAACAGTVAQIVSDDLMGTTVVLDHGDGYETVYANLQEHPAVEEGERVSAGQIIGSLGATALGESALAPHLHFAVTKDGEPFDPEEFLNT